MLSLVFAGASIASYLLTPKASQIGAIGPLAPRSLPNLKMSAKNLSVRRGELVSLDRQGNYKSARATISSGPIHLGPYETTTVRVPIKWDFQAFKMRPVGSPAGIFVDAIVFNNRSLFMPGQTAVPLHEFSRALFNSDLLRGTTSNASISVTLRNVAPSDRQIDLLFDGWLVLKNLPGWNL